MSFDRWSVLLLMVMVAGCVGDELDGPKRMEFDDVDRATINVDSGNVTIFGSDQVGGAMLQRWWSGDDDFDVLTESNSAQQLVIDSLCRGEWVCEVRYELGLQRSARVDARLARGTLNIYNLTSDFYALVEQGTLKAVGLQGAVADLEVDDGEAEVAFAEPPRHLRLQLGETASATVTLPDQSYQCNFDQSAERVEADGVECDQYHSSRIEIRPGDADVVFEVGDADAGDAPASLGW